MEPQWRPGPEPAACLTAAEIDPCLLTGNAPQIVLPMDSCIVPAPVCWLALALRQQCRFNHSVAIQAQHGMACSMPLCGCSILRILYELTKAHISLSTEAYRWITMMLRVYVISPIVGVVCVCVCVYIKWFNTSWRLKPRITHISQASTPSSRWLCPHPAPSSATSYLYLSSNRRQSIAAPVDEENLSPTSQRLINLLNSCKHPLANAQDGPSKARSDSSELAHDAQTLAVVPQLIRAHAPPSLRARRGFAPNGWKIASHAPLTWKYQEPGLSFQKCFAEDSQKRAAGYVAASVTQHSECSGFSALQEQS